MEPVVRLANFWKTYTSGEGAVHAVRGVDFAVFPGEMVAVMGASGSGKSTMMNTLGCLDRPTKGRYFLDGIDVSRLSRDQLSDVRNRRLGFVFQGFHLLKRTSAVKNVELPLLYSPHCPPRAELRRRALAALERVGLAGRANHLPNQLSGGQQQRVAIARALINEPKLLLADEPTGNLDTATSIEIMAIFQALNDEGKTIVMVTHELDIAQYCKRMVVMRDGRLVGDKPVEHRLSATEELARTRREMAAANLADRPAENGGTP